MKTVLIICVIVIISLLSCNGEKKNYEIVYAIISNPERIDSICSSNNYKVNNENINSMVFSVLRLKNKINYHFKKEEYFIVNSDQGDITHHYIMFESDDELLRATFCFHMKNNEWKLSRITSYEDGDEFEIN